MLLCSGCGGDTLRGLVQCPPPPPPAGLSLYSIQPVIPFRAFLTLRVRGSGCGFRFRFRVSGLGLGVGVLGFHLPNKATKPPFRMVPLTAKVEGLGFRV